MVGVQYDTQQPRQRVSVSSLGSASSGSTYSASRDVAHQQIHHGHQQPVDSARGNHVQPAADAGKERGEGKDRAGFTNLGYGSGSRDLAMPRSSDNAKNVSTLHIKPQQGGHVTSPQSLGHVEGSHVTSSRPQSAVSPVQYVSGGSSGITVGPASQRTSPYGGSQERLLRLGHEPQPNSMGHHHHPYHPKFSPQDCTAVRRYSGDITEKATSSALQPASISISISNSLNKPVSSSAVGGQPSSGSHGRPQAWSPHSQGYQGIKGGAEQEGHYTSSPSLLLDATSPPAAAADNDSYGLTITYRPPGGRGGAGDGFSMQKDSQIHFAPKLSPASKRRDRNSVPDRAAISLVTERMKKFESAESLDSKNGSGLSGSRSSSVGPPPSRRPPRPPPRVGYDSVLSRAADFETRFANSDASSDDEQRQRRSSMDKKWPSSQLSTPTGSASSLSQLAPPPEIHKVPATPPATVPFYFRHSHNFQDTKIHLDPSPERTLSSQAHLSVSTPGYGGISLSPGSDTLSAGSRSDRDRSPLSIGSSYSDIPQTSPIPQHGKPAARQPSYVAAINARKPGESKSGEWL